MALLYKHTPPGTAAPPRADRLRTWDDSSPYHAGRPKRGPRGPAGVLRFIEPNINWRNIPRIEAVTVHSMTKGAIKDINILEVGSMVLQSVTGVKPKIHRARKGQATWSLRPGMYISMTSNIRGDAAIEFVDKLIHLVLPKVKDWAGVAGELLHLPGLANFQANSGRLVWRQLRQHHLWSDPRCCDSLS